MYDSQCAKAARKIKTKVWAVTDTAVTEKILKGSALDKPSSQNEALENVPEYKSPEIVDGTQVSDTPSNQADSTCLETERSAKTDLHTVNTKPVESMIERDTTSSNINNHKQDQVKEIINNPLRDNYGNNDRKESIAVYMAIDKEGKTTSEQTHNDPINSIPIQFAEAMDEKVDNSKSDAHIQIEGKSETPLIKSGEV